MRKQLQDYLEIRVQQYVSETRGVTNPCEKAKLKREACLKRNAEIVKVEGKGEILSSSKKEEFSTVHYRVHLQYLTKQKDLLYLEEEIEYREAKFYKGVLVEDAEVPSPKGMETVGQLDFSNESERSSYQYNRLKAVQYAERWW
ncbi:MAG: hypothetical protein Q8898_13990, partial [Bacillota bacterium]|nr:hypothetical protein [Bacillota bacterium]